MKRGNAVSVIFVKADFSLKSSDGHFSLVLVLLLTQFSVYVHSHIKKKKTKNFTQNSQVIQSTIRYSAMLPADIG